jgi:hypothetical protein
MGFVRFLTDTEKPEYKLCDSRLGSYDGRKQASCGIKSQHEV